MIKYIRGTYAMTFESGIVVETASGIGFAVHVPTGSPLYRSREGEAVMVYTRMIVKEDDISQQRKSGVVSHVDYRKRRRREGGDVNDGFHVRGHTAARDTL